MEFLEQVHSFNTNFGWLAIVLPIYAIGLSILLARLQTVQIPSSIQKSLTPLQSVDRYKKYIGRKLIKFESGEGMVALVFEGPARENFPGLTQEQIQKFSAWTALTGLRLIDVEPLVLEDRVRLHFENDFSADLLQPLKRANG